MTVAPTAVVPAGTVGSSETKLYETVTRFLEEARSGPANSGLSETVNVLGTDIEMSASQGWGVRFSRTLPNGTVEFRHLAGNDLTVDAAADAYAALLRLS